MAQFDVYKNPNKATNLQVPYLLDIQHDILQNINTRVVVPLILNIESIKNLNPEFKINNQIYMMSTAEMATIPTTLLGDKVANLESQRSEILNAIDFLISGF
jgi:toxin CcdB